MEKESRIRLIFKLSIFGFCLIGLSLQTWYLIDQYWSGRTVVNDRFENNGFDKLPSFTLCFPYLFSMKMVAKKFNLTGEYQEYLDTIRNASYTHDYKYNLDHLYWNRFESKAFESELTVDEVLELSIPRYVSKDLSFFRISVVGVKIASDGTYEETEIVGDTHPIESFIHDYYPQKCFTSYSQLDKSWRDIAFNVDHIRFSMRNLSVLNEHIDSYMVRRYYNRNKVKLAMHSADTIPESINERDFTNVKLGYETKMSYYQKKTVLLGAGYQTNCRSYGFEDEYALRSDCINHCMQTTLAYCLVNANNNYLFWSRSLWNNMTLSIIRKMKLHKMRIENSMTKSKIECNKLNIRQKCLDKCRPECVNLIYQTSLLDSNVSENNETIIEIEHDHTFDHLAEHIPEVTFTAFAAGLGGLISMWLGLSALAILDFVIKYVHGHPKKAT